VETAGLGLAFADVAGLERTLGPDGRLAGELAQDAGRAAGVGIRVGVAGQRFVAEQAARAARSGSGRAVPPGRERALVGPLPLSVLPAEAEFVRRLHMLGVRNLGALAALPQLALVRQFGPPAGFLHELASGRDPRPIQPDAPPLVLEGRHDFEPPVADRGSLIAWAGRLLADLAADLSRRGYQAEGLRVELEDEIGDVIGAAAGVEPPSADTQRLARRAAALLEGQSPARPVVALKLYLYPLRPAHLGASQLALFTAAADHRMSRLQEVLRRLRERFGEMVIMVASLLGPPPPRAIQVTCTAEGSPRSLVWPDRILPVARVYEHWRERRRWWTLPVERDYYRAETVDERVRVLFRDRRNDRWWLERRHL
jgi:DNA polymerase-4